MRLLVVWPMMVACLCPSAFLACVWAILKPWLKSLILKEQSMYCCNFWLILARMSCANAWMLPTPRKNLVITLCRWCRWMIILLCWSCGMVPPPPLRIWHCSFCPICWLAPWKKLAKPIRWLFWLLPPVIPVRLLWRALLMWRVPKSLFSIPARAWAISKSAKWLPKWAKTWRFLALRAILTMLNAV